MNAKPLLGITLGDPASIGPEVAVKAVADARFQPGTIDVFDLDYGKTMHDAAKR